MSNNHPPEPAVRNLRERALIVAELFPLPPTPRGRGLTYQQDRQHNPDCKGMTYREWEQWRLDSHRRWMRYPRWFRRMHLPQWLRWLLWERPRQAAQGLPA